MSRIAQIRRALLGVAVAAMVFPGLALADVAQTIRADLQSPASNVPGAQVTVAAPTGDETLIGPGQSVNVTMTPPFGSPLAGIMVPLGAQPLYSTTSPQLLVWDLAVIEAAKHAIVAGNQFDSIAITRNYPGVAPLGYPDLIFAAPLYHPLAQVPATMTTETIRSKVQQALPVWAQQGVVSVVDDAVGERVVSVKVGLPAAGFRTIGVGGLLGTLVGQQLSLAPGGANIGRVIAEIDNPVTGDPLYQGGADASVSYVSDWYSPLVEGLSADVPSVRGAAKPGLDAAVDGGAPPPPTGPVGPVP